MQKWLPPVNQAEQPRLTMSVSGARILTAICVAALLVSASPAFTQSGEQKAGEQKQQAGDSPKDGQKTLSEFAEAARVLGGPAANPECVWLGRRVVAWLWTDDLDTAFRHLDLYDRFGCPGGHIQAAFRCVVRQGPPDRKSNEPNTARAHACWVDPGLQPAAAATAPAGSTGSR
jgi:hypothetical protein